MRVAGYGRMSTDKQQMSPEVQERRVRDWVAERIADGGLPKDAEFVGMFVDAAVTSQKDLLERKAGQHVLSVLGAGDLIVVAKFDRAFRSPADCERTLRKCKEAGIAFRFIDVALDEQSANGQLFAGMLALAAKYERDMRSETTKDALAYRRQTGHAQCLPPWGWKIDAKEKGERTVRMKRLYADRTGRNIANACLHLLRNGVSKYKASKIIKESMDRNGISGYPYSHETILKAATCAALGFPKQSIRFCSRLLGRKLQTMEFITSDECDSVRQQLEQLFIEEGIDGY